MLYIGYTADLKRRFEEHNAGLSFATKFRRPFDLIYYEAYLSQTDALVREKKLKKFKSSYRHLKLHIQNSLE